MTRDGLMNPNHYLAAAVWYLFQHRQGWPQSAAVGKTVVSSSMIDRVAAGIGRRLYEVPVGFKWFVDGLLDGSLGFGGEESAGASFQRMDGSVWTTDKDGIILDLLAAEILAKTGRDPAQHYADLESQYGAPVYERTDAPANTEQKAALSAPVAGDGVRQGDGRGAHCRDFDACARQRCAHRRAEDRDGERVVRGAAVGDGGDLQDLRGEFPGRGAFGADSGRGAGDSADGVSGGGLVGSGCVR